MRWIALALVLAAVGFLGAGCGGSGLREVYIASSAMEPTLHCAKPGAGCRANSYDHVVVQVGKPVKRGDIIAFQAAQKVMLACGSGPLMVKRIVGLPDETVSEDDHGFISVNGKRLSEPYVSASARALDTANWRHHWKVPAGKYFVLGDNRSESCDSRVWGGVARHNVIGPIVKIVRGS
jgi:signal peptidase I